MTEQYRNNFIPSEPDRISVTFPDPVKFFRIIFLFPGKALYLWYQLKINSIMNVFDFAYSAEENWKANLRDDSGFVPEYTFYSDFGIAEFCQVYMKDKDAVKKTYNKVVRSYGKDYKAFIELILVLNHKIWAYWGNPETKNPGIDTRRLGIGFDRGNEIAELYDGLWRDAQDKFFKRYENNKDAMSYYFEVTD